MMTAATHIIFLLVLSCIHFGTAQVATYVVHVGDLYKMQRGIGWPSSMEVSVGHEALLKLSSELDNFETCEVTTPDGVEFNIRQPPSDRYELWDDSCSVRVKNVVPADHGRWRLTATRGAHSITGWTAVHVEENIDHYSGAPIVLHDGDTYTNVELSTLHNSYCLVAQPFSESSLVPGHCSIMLNRTTRAVQGNWHVLLGLPGRVSELEVDRNVAVESERLDVGFLRGTNPNKLHLYCNIEHTVKNITFCRFQKTSDRAGFNVRDGLSDGTHSYYGEGFGKRQCGMTIEHPTAADYGTWRCTVGVQEWEGTTLRQRTPLQALIRVVYSATSLQRVKRSSRDGEDVRIVFVERNMNFTVSCRADASLSYCWFQHPNGTQYTPTVLLSEHQLFWYSGETLQVGDCTMTMRHATDEDEGLWTCHMGPQDFVGEEYTDEIEVRVTGPLAAREKEVAAYVGGNVTLFCHTSNGYNPLDYCRFLTPQFVGISVDSSVTPENPVLGRFYFTPGRDLNYGDCSLTINPVLEVDLGEWTCAARVDRQILESRDTINIVLGVACLTSWKDLNYGDCSLTCRYLLGSRYTIITVLRVNPTAFRAGVIGMSIGISVLVVALVGALVYKYRRSFPISIPWRRTNNIDRTNLETRTERSDNISLEVRSGRMSLESDSSGSVYNSDEQRSQTPP